MHRPEETLLYELVETHWPTFRKHAEATGGVPRFVQREVEEYLRCGTLEFGAMRVACRECGSSATRSIGGGSTPLGCADQKAFFHLRSPRRVPY